MIQGIALGVVATIVFAYECETGILDMELVYSQNRTKLFMSKLVALILIGIAYFFTSTLVLIIYNLRGSWLIESFYSLLSLGIPPLIQIIFIISLNVLISVVSEKTVISILSSALTFYSLDNLLRYSNPQPGSLLYSIPPVCTSASILLQDMPVGNLLTALIISLGFLLIAYIYFARFYEVK